MPTEYDTSNPSTLMPGGNATDSQVQPGSKNDILFQRVKKNIMLPFFYIFLHVTFPPPWRKSRIKFSDEKVEKMLG